MEHLEIGKQVMRKKDRLRGLKVGVSGQNQLDIPPRLHHHGGKHFHQSALKLKRRVLHVQAHLGCHQIIAAAAGAQLARHVPDLAFELSLHPGMDVLSGLPLRPAWVALDFAAQRFQTCGKLPGLARFQRASLSQAPSRKQD